MVTLGASMFGMVSHTLLAWSLASLMTLGNAMAWWHCGECESDSLPLEPATYCGTAFCLKPIAKCVRAKAAEKPTDSRDGFAGERDGHKKGWWIACLKAVHDDVGAGETRTSVSSMPAVFIAISRAVLADHDELRDILPRAPPATEWQIGRFAAGCS